MSDVKSLKALKRELQIMIEDYTDMNEDAKEIVIYNIEKVED